VAAIALERKLYVDGEWIETGDWIEVRSPYSGDVVGRVAKGGAAETRRAVDAAERALAVPLPAHRRAEILVRVAGALGRRHDEAAQLICDETVEPGEVDAALATRRTVRTGASSGGPRERPKVLPRNDFRSAQVP